METSITIDCMFMENSMVFADELVEIFYDKDDEIVAFQPHLFDGGRIDIITDRKDFLNKPINDIVDLCEITFEKMVKKLYYLKY